MPYPPYQDDRAPADTPPGAEQRLESYRDQMDEAREALAKARDAELEAKGARDAEERRVRLSDDCPKVGVVDGKRTTVAYVEAWVADKIAGLDKEYQLAKVRRQAANEHLRTLGKQGGFQQTITRSVGETYRNPPSGRNW